MFGHRVRPVSGVNVSRMRNVYWGLSLPAAVLASLALAACGGGSNSESAAQTATTSAAVDAGTTTAEGDDLQQAETETVAETETGGGSSDAGPAAAPGEGTLDLGDKVYAITVTECKFQPGGSFTVKGTTDDGAAFDMTQFYLNDEWSQTQVQVETDKLNVYAIIGRATEGAEPASVTGKNVTWTREFRTLDVAANAFAGPAREGTLNLTCN